ncbi:hypothetical protein AB0I94_33485 [Streptomyces sp. NPDC050147]|uniref:hypothetical protein n=1 Tax=Streptomyces sp. NPDC050147 TaxID=3155513 RepID=UPI003422F04C
MPLIALAVFALVISFERLIQGKLNPMGLLALAILAIGFKTKRPFVAFIGAFSLALLLVDSF